MVALGLIGTYAVNKSRRIADEHHGVELNKQQGSIDNLQRMLQTTQLTNAADMGYLKGRLDTLTAIKAGADIGQLGTAIARANADLIKKESERASNAQLSAMAISLAQKMREFERKTRTERESLWARRDMRIRQAKPEERAAVFSQESTVTTQQYVNAEMEFRNTLLGRAVYLRDALLERLPPQSAEAEPSWKLIAFNGVLAGPTPVADAADYLEKLARQLSPQ